MSFWTGFTTGLASSVDKGLQKAIEKRDGELSAAKNFWMQRKATKLEKAEEKKEAYDEKADKAFDILADELGDTSFARAVMQKLGGADEALTYIQKVNDTRATLQPGETYSMVDDFKGYVAPKTEVTAEQNRQAIRMKMPSMGQVTAEDLAVDDPIARLFGQDSKLASRAAETINTRFADVSKIDSTPISDVGTIAQVDLSRQIAAKEAAYTQVTRGREDTRFNIEVSAAKQNTSRIEQAMKIAAAAEKRAVGQFASDADQRKLENARAEVEALQRQTQLIQDAEAHVKNMELKDLSIEEAKAEAQKRKEHPIFKSYEDMAVYATQKLAAGNLTDQQKSDFNRMYTDAIAGANAYNTATSDKGGTGIEFAKQSLDSMVEAARKLELEKIPTKSIGDKVEMVIKGNEATYYGGMERALNTVAKRLTPEGGTMPDEAQRYIESLKADNTQKAFGFASSVAAEYAAAKAEDKSTAKINYVPFNVVAGAVKSLQQANPNMTDGQATIKYAKENNLQAGTVVPSDTTGTKYAIWTGTRFIDASDMGR